MEEAPIFSQRGAFIAKLGAWLQLAQFIGLAGTAVGMMKAFDSLKTEGAGDPVKLSGAIGEVLIYTAIGVGLTFAGFILITIAITALRYRARWMFQFLCFYGLLILGLNLCLIILGHFAFTLHLPFGLFFLIFALMKKEESMRATPVKQQVPACYKLDD